MRATLIKKKKAIYSLHFIYSQWTDDRGKDECNNANWPEAENASRSRHPYKRSGIVIGMAEDGRVDHLSSITCQWMTYTLWYVVCTVQERIVEAAPSQRSTSAVAAADQTSSLVPPAAGRRTAEAHKGNFLLRESKAVAHIPAEVLLTNVSK